MLNGVAPILIFSFPILPKGTFNMLSGIPLVGESLAASVALPIPIYLDEKITGVYIDSESKSIDIQTEIDAKSDGTKPDVSQRGLASNVTINIKASRNSVVLSALLALIDLCFQKVVSREYSVSYLNGATTIFGGLLDSFTVDTDFNNDLYIISLTISQGAKVTKSTEAARFIDRIPAPGIS